MAPKRHEESNNRDKDAHETHHEKTHPTRFDLCSTVGAMHLPSGQPTRKHSHRKREDCDKEGDYREDQLEQSEACRDHTDGYSIQINKIF
ncbi:hypothetical protein [Natrinema versiforme]|uniref:hypothetical protein n=1 Tax=Natrinema versiforme TaxID=88724 RepID=UPI00135F17E2|nr:hypothetical protein [Natrinema versiforme]